MVDTLSQSIGEHRGCNVPMKFSQTHITCITGPYMPLQIMFTIVCRLEQKNEIIQWGFFSELNFTEHFFCP